MIVIADTGPLISFSVIDKLELLDLLFGQVVIPDAVWRELETFIVPFAIPKAQKYQNRVVPLREPVKESLKLGLGEEEACGFLQNSMGIVCFLRIMTPGNWLNHVASPVLTLLAFWFWQNAESLFMLFALFFPNFWQETGIFPCLCLTVF